MMNIEKVLHERSNSTCELCKVTEDLTVFVVQPVDEETEENCILTCSNCKLQMEELVSIDVNHWRCLNDSMWSDIPAVQVVAWRMLYQLREEGWTQDLLDMMYMDNKTMSWARALIEAEVNKVVHLDSNGAVLNSGDTVTLIKDLNVKGASFIAKRGTAVRRISLVHDNPEHIEGRVNGQHIVILTKYVKKSK